MTRSKGIRPQPITERFWAKVEKCPDDGCWQWTGTVTRHGYGQIRYASDGWKNASAHRVSWELANGPIPRAAGHHGICVLHRCDNRRCVRPSHLFLGTVTDNNRDRSQKGRSRQPLRGEDSNLSKYSAAFITSIRLRAASGERQCDIARSTGLHKNYVGLIVRRLRWSHLP